MADDRNRPGRYKQRSKREQLALFRALPGDLAPRDAQDLLAYSFFPLAKCVVPISFRVGKVSVRIQAVPAHGMAQIWDADVLIWAASRIVEARDVGLKTSRLIAATPYELLTFVGRGIGARDCDRLTVALDRPQTMTVITLICQPTDGRRHRLLRTKEWQETAGMHGRPLGLELILPDWFFSGVPNGALVLTIDRAYFALTGGLERWLYRVAHKHASHQDGGQSFDLAYLHARSGRLSPLKHFACDLREIVRRQTLPGYRLVVEPAPRGAERLILTPNSRGSSAERLHVQPRKSDGADNL